MTYSKKILCLAKSRKHCGYCFAGKEVETGEWIRPVSHRPGEEILPAECSRPGGKRTKLLDVLEIPLLKPKPSGYQSENHLIDPTKKWKKKGEATWQDVEEAIDEHTGPLWLNGGASYGFLRNRVHESEVGKLKNSLVLIRPQRLKLRGSRRGGSYSSADDWLVKAYFSHAKIDYTLQVTDPVMEREFPEGSDRVLDLTGAVLCISLGEIYKHHAYKLVAAVIEPFEDS